MFKKTLSTVLAVVMLCSLLPAIQTFAALTTPATPDQITEYRQTLADAGVILPESFAWNTTDFDVDRTDLIPTGKTHILLTANDTAAYNNFTQTVSNGAASGATFNSSNILNPITEGGKGIRKTHATATFVVPGTEAKTFQLVTIGRGDEGLEVKIDGQVFSTTAACTISYHDWCSYFGAPELAETWAPNTLISLPARFDWDKTITLEPGVHTITYKINNTGLYAALLTESVGYDWTQIHQVAGIQNNVAARNNIAKTFGAAGYIDYTAPVAVTGLTQTANDFNSVTLGWDAVSETGTAYTEYAYTITIKDGTETVATKTVVDGTETVVIDGLQVGKSYTATISAMDMVGNKGAESSAVTISTKSLAESDQAYFTEGSAVEFTNVTQNFIGFGLDGGIAKGAQATSGTLAYNVYFNGELYLEDLVATTNVEKNNLIPETEYTIKLVPTLNGVESTVSHLETKVTTSSLSYIAANDLLLAPDTIGGWPQEGKTEGGGVTGYLWARPSADPDNNDEAYWYAINGDSYTSTLTVREPGKYYLVANAGSYTTGASNFGRYAQIKVNGTVVNRKNPFAADTTDDMFGNSFGSADGGLLNGDAHRDISAEPVVEVTTVPTAVTVNIEIKGSWPGDVTRVDYVGLIKADSYAAAETIANTFTSKEAVMDYFYGEIMKDYCITSELVDNTVQIEWAPLENAKSNKTITYELFINGKLTKTYDWQGRAHTYEMSFDAENGGLTLGENTIKFVAKKDGLEVYSKTFTHTVDASSVESAYFSGATLKAAYSQDATIEELTTQLVIDWEDAVVNDGTFDGTYNVYINNAKVANVTESQYVAVGLSAATEYEVKVIIADAQGEEFVSNATNTLAATLSTGNEATVIVDEVTANSVALTITNTFGGEADYEIAQFGQAAVWNEANGVFTITDLLDNTPYDFTIKITEVIPGTDVEYITVLNASATTALDDNAELTYATGTPIFNHDYAVSVGKGGVEYGEVGNSIPNDGLWNCVPTDAYQAHFGNAWAAGDGYSITLPFTLATGGEYYVGVIAGCYASGTRYITVKVDDTAFSDHLSQNTNSMTRDVTDNPIALAAGDHTLTITANGGWCRVDHAVLISAASSSAALTAYQDASVSAEAIIDAFGSPSTNISEQNVQATLLGTDKIMVTWMPNQAAADKELSYQVKLNDGEFVEYGNAGRRHTFTAEDGIKMGQNTITLKVIEGFETITITKTILVEELIKVTTNVATGDIIPANGTATLTVNNPTGQVKDLLVMAMVYRNNRVIEKHFVDLDLLVETDVTFQLGVEAKVTKQTGVLLENTTQVKFFVLDMADNAYRHNAFNY